jgi:hypothetical protein
VVLAPSGVLAPSWELGFDLGQQLPHPDDLVLLVDLDVLR